MAIFFEKYIGGFSRSPASKIYNKRIVNFDLKNIKRIDLTFTSEEQYNRAEYLYLENLKALKQVLPVPEFLLKPIRKYKMDLLTIQRAKKYGFK